MLKEDPTMRADQSQQQDQGEASACGHKLWSWVVGMGNLTNGFFHRPMVERVKVVDLKSVEDRTFE